MWMMRSASGPATIACSIVSRSASLAPSPTRRHLVSMPSTMATSTSRVPIISVPIASNSGLPVITVRPTARNAKTRPRRAATSSSSTTGSSGAFAWRTNWTQLCLPRTRFDSLTAVRSENDSSTIAIESTRIGSHATSSSCGCCSLSMPS